MAAAHLWLLLFHLAAHASRAPRRQHVVAQQPDSPRSWLEELRAALLGEEEEPSAELQSLAGYLASEPGFSLRMTLGSQPARGAGGSGKLARQASPTVTIELPVAFSVDETPGLDPFQGDVRLLKDSTYFTTPPSFWSAEYERAGDTLLWQMRVACRGIGASGEVLVPEGEPVFFNARIGKSRLGQWELSDGTVTVRETVPFSGGVLAELKIVGTFDAVKLDVEQAAVSK